MLAGAVSIIVGSFLLPLSAGGQDAGRDYPSKAIRLIVPYGTGGSTDVVSRILAAKLTERLSKQVIVENRPGANGIIGTNVVAKSTADGYTFLMASNGQAVNISLYQKLPFDMARDLVSVVNVAVMPNVLAVHPSQPMRALKDIVAEAKRRPGALTYGHAGLGSSQHLCGELLKLIAGINIEQVPYKGGGPAVVDALAGQVPMVFAGLPAVIQHVKTGRLRGIAVTSQKRSALLPDTPTIAEQGYPGFNNVFWIAILAPRGVPNAIIARINAEVNAVISDPDTVQQFATQGVEPVGGASQQLDAFLRDEIETAARIIREAGIKVDG